MNLGFTHGKMVGCMMDFTRMIRSIAMEYILGLIKKGMLAGGT